MAPPVLFAVASHEVAHGYVASLKGDDTAKSLGRLTLNPLRHIDPFGTILLPIIFYFSFGAPIGYAKPVPVNMAKLNSPRKDMAWVAFAGPAMNFTLAFISTLLLKIVSLADYMAYKSTINLFLPGRFTETEGGGMIAAALCLMLIFSIWINLVLAIINLIPILPADGGRIFASFLPPEAAIRYSKMERWGLVLLFGLLLLNPFNILGSTLIPILLYLFEFLISII